MRTSSRVRGRTDGEFPNVEMSHDRASSQRLRSSCCGAVEERRVCARRVRSPLVPSAAELMGTGAVHACTPERMQAARRMHVLACLEPAGQSVPCTQQVRLHALLVCPHCSTPGQSTQVGVLSSLSLRFTWQARSPIPGTSRSTLLCGEVHTFFASTFSVSNARLEHNPLFSRRDYGHAAGCHASSWRAGMVTIRPPQASPVSPNLPRRSGIHRASSVGWSLHTVPL